MSKSKPETCIFIYDSPDEIRKKIRRAFCPEKVIQYNPILEFCKYIIFREKQTFIVERPAKYGGHVEFQSYEQLEKAYKEGKIHPLDLKNAVAEELIKILEPVRRYFKSNKEAEKCLETIKKVQITR